jgi:[protein-PII] uridylyltransferase
VDSKQFREQRAALLTNDDRQGIEFCREYSVLADEWLRGIASRAVGESPRKIALIAVGGYGRGELSPYSDLDLLLVYDGIRKVKPIADKIWYPIWDEGIALDHSVRKPKEVYAVANEDLRVALGLLDGRFVWGDESIAQPILQNIRTQWSGNLGARWIPVLEQQMRLRHEEQGDLADLLEPDLKESHGGLRDFNVLTAVLLAFPDIAHRTDLTHVERARDTLLDVRVALHRIVGRGVDRLQLQEQDQVADRLHFQDADELMRTVSAAARVVARTTDATWYFLAHQRTTDAAEPTEQLESGIALVNHELTISDPSLIQTDPTLVLRLAALSAERDEPMSMSSLELLTKAPSILEPWPESVRLAFIRLLSAPKGLVRAVETLDAYNLFTKLLPEWSAVRSYHQRNAYHRYTADRHLLEAVRFANSAETPVARRDLLLLGTLFHDIGKGHGGDHTNVGVELVQRMGPRMGFSDDDTAVLVAMVRHHLLLPDSATRRDLEDPATIRFVAAAIGDEEILELVGALARADGLATGSSAWGPWKSQLVDDLVRRVRTALRGEQSTSSPLGYRDLIEQARSEGLVVRHEGEWLLVAARDQPRLLATITGVLAVAGLDVRSADVHAEEGVALDRFYCSPGPRGWPNPEQLSLEIHRALESPNELANAISARIASYAHRPRSARRIEPGAQELPAASDRATVIEVRAADHLGLLHQLALVVADAGVDVKAARLSTVGDFAVDTFYVTDAHGNALDTEKSNEVTLRLGEAVLSTS